jgi:flagellar basal body-associated protein FliL
MAGMRSGPMPMGTRPSGQSAPGSRAARKPAGRETDYTLAYALSLAVIVAIIAFVIGWAWLKPQAGKIETDVAFDKVGPFHIETEGYTYNASLAVQTAAGDARWLRRHHDTINETLYRSLLATHPRALTTPAGLVALQQSMTQSVNSTLDQPRVQHVLFTDFVIQQD